MGWLRLVGSLKLYVSLAEYSLFYGAVFQKRLGILWSLLYVATPQLGVRDNRHNTQITPNEKAVRALRSTSNQSSEPCKVAHYPQQKIVGLSPQYLCPNEDIKKTEKSF